MGYQNQVLPSGSVSVMKCATFDTVSGATMKFGDIKVNENFAFGSDSLQTLTGTGGTDLTLTYLSAEAGAEFNCTAGWYDYAYVNGNDWDWESQIPDEYNYTNHKVPSGFGFIIQAASDDTSIEIPSPLAE